MRVVETGRNSSRVPTQSSGPVIGEKGPISLRDDTCLLLQLKQSLDQIDYGPNYDAAAERRAWQRFALAGRKTDPECQSGTDEDDDKNSQITVRPAVRNAAGGPHSRHSKQMELSTAVGRCNSRAAHDSDDIQRAANDKIIKNSDYCSKHIAGADAASSSHQQDHKTR
jgi:hypothetical protein